MSDGPKMNNTEPTTLHSREAEAMVLGCMMHDIAMLELMCDQLCVDDFDITDHKALFALLKEYNTEHPKHIDLGIVMLRAGKDVDAVGGIAYLSSLAMHGISADLELYTAEVLRYSTLRAMRAQAASTYHAANKAPQDVDKLLEATREAYFRMGNRAASCGSSITIDTESDKRHIAKLQENVECRQLTGQGHMLHPGLQTGYAELDRCLMGIKPKQVIVIGGGTAVGKSTFALNIIAHVAIKQRVRVGLVTLEMSSHELWSKILGAQADVDTVLLDHYNSSDEDLKALVDVDAQLHDMIIVDDKGDANISDICVKIRRWKEKHNIGLAVIDHLHMITPSGASGGTYQNIVEITRRIKLLAMQLDIPIILLSQLNRGCNADNAQVPTLASLRDSGSIEQDANAVILMYRKPENKADVCETVGVILAKNRGGPLGSWTWYFKKHISRILEHKPAPLPGLYGEQD